MKNLKTYELILKGWSKVILVVFCMPLFLLSSCKKEDPIPNRAPADFIVQATLDADGTTVKLSWIKAVDPDGDAVSYTIILGDTLAKNLSDTTFIIADLGYDFTEEGKIIARDPAGLSTEVKFFVTTLENPFFEIPDPNFEKYLVDAKIDKDGIVNGKMAKVDANGLKKIDCYGRKINSLVGIEQFVDLEELNCYSNSISSIDVSKNLKLKTLNCFTNSLTVLDLSKNTNLENLRCLENSLTALDISKNTNLKILECGDNSISTLDVSKNLNLTTLFCFGNSLTVLDVSNNLNLVNLVCNKNSLTILDVSKNINLETLGCSYNVLATLNLNSNLKDLDCSHNSLKDLDVTKNSNLKVLFCHSNSLLALDVSKNPNLIRFYCYNNSLTDLDISQIPYLDLFRCEENALLKAVCVANVTTANAKVYWKKDDATEYKICN
ncbi:hypothetical protein SAMN06298216_2319 [Spirosomataceae bacterium TFI 002]|nr:hypothetical protein SAMN06298216_2319 [Spirosomataceae bacterium TFI 002]